MLSQQHTLHDQLPFVIVLLKWEDPFLFVLLLLSLYLDASNKQQDFELHLPLLLMFLDLNNSVITPGKIERPRKIYNDCFKWSNMVYKYIYTSGCHNRSIPLDGSDLGIIQLGFSLGETIWISFFFLFAPKQPKFSAGKRNILNDQQNQINALSKAYMKWIKTQ